MAGAGLLIVLSTGSLSGLWLVLLGWYLSQTARAEASFPRLTGTLGSVPVGRLMTSAPVCGYTGQTVASFAAGVAASHPHRRYPILDLDGNLAGLITVDLLAAIPPPRRSTTRLADLLIPASRLRLAQRDTPISDPSALPADPLRITVVVDGSRPCGVLTAGDLARALAIARLGEIPDRSPGAFEDLRPLP